MSNEPTNSSANALEVSLSANLYKRVGSEVSTEVPKVSIIIPTYKVAEFIAETLDSVFSQSLKSYEAIVINDGSPDTEEFEKAIEPYKERIIYLKIENSGAGPARNIAIRNARGEFLAFLDGDDIWNTDFLESQVKFLEENNYDMAYSDAIIFGNSFMSGRRFTQDAPSQGEVNFESLLDLRCNVVLSSTVVRKQAVIDAGMFEWKKVRAQDFNLWLRLAHRGARIAYQKEPLVKYRMRKSSLSGDSLMRVDREINSYNRILENIALNDSEKGIVSRQLTRLIAEKEIILGKSYLLSGDYAAAKGCFEKGSEYRKSFKLRSIIFMLKVAPRLLVKIYQKRRTGEIEYMPDTINLSR